MREGARAASLAYAGLQGGGRGGEEEEEEDVEDSEDEEEDARGAREAQEEDEFVEDILVPECAHAVPWHCKPQGTEGPWLNIVSGSLFILSLGLGSHAMSSAFFVHPSPACSCVQFPAFLHGAGVVDLEAKLAGAA